MTSPASPYSASEGRRGEPPRQTAEQGGAREDADTGQDTAGQVKRQLVMLIDISIEILLNADDSDFAHPPENRPVGTIHYVFDETVFEFLIDPDERRRKYPAFFHLRLWRDLYDRARQAAWIRINEMLSIATAEFLFSRKLPGQKDGKIYMTSWHRQELMKSLHARSAGTEAVSSNLDQAAIDRLRRLLETSGALAADAPDKDLDDQLLWQDLGHGLAGHSTLGPARPDLLRARRLANLFAVNRVVLRGVQMQRILPDMQHFGQDRTRDEIAARGWEGIEGDFPSVSAAFPLLDNDMDALHSLARTFQVGLERDAGSRRAGARTRNVAGLRRDAYSLALVQHIARHSLDSAERIVLVTGDSLMLSTYREWFADRAAADPSEPCIIRGIGRYAPIANVRDMLRPSEQDADNPFRDPFKLIQATLAAVMAPLNFSRIQDDDDLGGAQAVRKIANLWHLRRMVVKNLNSRRAAAPATSIAARVRLTGAAGPATADADYLDVALSQDVLRDAAARFHALHQDLAVQERNAIGAAGEFLRARQEILFRNCPPHDANDQSFVDYFVHVARDNYAASVSSSLIPALELITRPDQVMAPAADPELRVPIGLFLTTGLARDVEGHPMNIVDFEASLAGTDRTERATLLQNLPKTFADAHPIFVLCALASMRRKAWSDADYYAGLAKSAYRLDLGSAEDRDRDEGYHEVRYLRAVCARLMFGSIAWRERNAPDADARRRLRDLRQSYSASAERNLNKCLRFHEPRGQRLRLARAQSEYASLQIFAAIWAHAETEHDTVDQFGLRADLLSLASDRLAPAFESLAHVLRQERSRIHVQIQQRVCLQILANAVLVDGLLARLPDYDAGAHPALAPLLARAKTALPSEQPKRFAIMARFAVRDFLRRHAIAAAEWQNPATQQPHLAIDRRIIALLN